MDASLRRPVARWRPVEPAARAAPLRWVARSRPAEAWRRAAAPPSSRAVPPKRGVLPNSAGLLRPRALLRQRAEPPSRAAARPQALALEPPVPRRAAAPPLRGVTRWRPEIRTVRRHGVRTLSPVARATTIRPSTGRRKGATAPRLDG